MNWFTLSEWVQGYRHLSKVDEESDVFLREYIESVRNRFIGISSIEQYVAANILEWQLESTRLAPRGKKKEIIKVRTTTGSNASTSPIAPPPPEGPLGPEFHAASRQGLRLTLTLTLTPHLSPLTHTLTLALTVGAIGGDGGEEEPAALCSDSRSLLVVE